MHRFRRFSCYQYPHRNSFGDASWVFRVAARLGLVSVLLRALAPWANQRVPGQKVGVPDYFGTVQEAVSETGSVENQLD